MYAVQKGIKLDSKSPDGKKFLFGLMDQLEQVADYVFIICVNFLCIYRR